MRAGKLDRRITIQTPMVTQNAAGEEVIVWSNFAEDIPAQRTYRTGSEEAFQAIEQNAESRRNYTIRWIDGITEKMRVEDDGRYFDIMAFEEIGRRRGLTLITIGYPNRS